MAIGMAAALLCRAVAAKPRREQVVAREANVRRDTFQLLVHAGSPADQAPCPWRVGLDHNHIAAISPPSRLCP